jgi:hypothetical protein
VQETSSELAACIPGANAIGQTEAGSPREILRDERASYRNELIDITRVHCGKSEAGEVAILIVLEHARSVRH